MTAAPSPRLRDAVKQLVAAKLNSGRRQVYTANLEDFLNAFASRIGDVALSEITTEHVESWVGEAAAPWSKASRLNRVSTLFSFAVRRGWIQANPCDRIERIRIDRRPPAILSVVQCRAILRCAGARIRPWLVLGLFVGLRPSEAARMDWSGIRVRDAVVVVDSAASKVRRRRIVPLHDTARAWLSLDAIDSGPVVSSHSTLRRDRRHLARAAGIMWTADILRHTFGSMRIGAGHPVAATADEMGNSPAVLLTHYRELVRKEDAQAFWGILP